MVVVVEFKGKVRSVGWRRRDKEGRDEVEGLIGVEKEMQEGGNIALHSLSLTRLLYWRRYDTRIWRLRHRVPVHPADFGGGVSTGQGVDDFQAQQTPDAEVWARADLSLQLLFFFLPELG